MKKFSVLLIVLAVMVALVSCATKAPAEEAAPAVAEPVAEAPVANVCPFAGEYYFEFTSADATEPQPGEEFIVEEDWTIHGATEGSGLTGFEGTVQPDGSFHIEYTRLGGEGNGKINEDFTFTSHNSVRGRESDFSGYRL